MPTVRRLLAPNLAMLLLATACAAWLLMAWRHQLPDPLATHFDGGGTPDGYTGQTANLVMTLVLGTVLPLAMIVPVALLARGPGTRPLLAIATGSGIFLIATFVSGAASQRGLADAHQAQFPVVAILPPLAIGLGAGLLAYRLTPTCPGTPAADGPAPATPLAARERAVWSSHERSPVVAWAGAVTLLLAVVFYGVTRQAGWAILLGVTSLPLVTMSSVRVTVDQEGLRYDLGIVRRRIALSTITAAYAVHVNPPEYGGWGYRIGPKGFAIVMRGGPGLTIRRAGHSDLTITVPDAEQGAGLLNAYLARRGTPAGPAGPASPGGS